MKVSFFAVVMLGISALNVNAVRMYSMPETFAEVDAKPAAEIDADADKCGCDVVKVNIPECAPKPNPEALIMEAVGDMEKRAAEIKQAISINAANKCTPKIAYAPIPKCSECDDPGLIAKMLGFQCGGCLPCQRTCGTCNTCNACNTCNTCCDPCKKEEEKKDDSKDEKKDTK